MASQPTPPSLSEPDVPTPDSFAKELDETTLATLRTILARVAEQRAAVASLFEHASPLRIDAKRVVFAFAPSSFLLQQVQEPGVIELLTAAVTEHFGQPTVVEIDTAGHHLEVETVAARDAALRAAEIARARKAVTDHPLVQAAISELGAELKDVRLPS